MEDIYQSEWFSGVQGHNCRIVLQVKGPITYEFLEYEDEKRDPFQWQGNLICGSSFSRMGMRCIEPPQSVIAELNAFMKTLPRGTKIMRNGTHLIQI